MNFYKYKILQIFLILFYSLPSSSIYAQGFIDIWEINTVTSLVATEHKPQSKTWNYGGYWWAVIPEDTSTWLWRLDVTNWTKNLFLSDSTKVHADTKVDGDVTHILLYSGTSSQLVSVEYVPASNSYQLWSTRPGLVNLTLGSGVETATIDIDGTGRMWLAYEASNDIIVKWSDSDYSTWSSPITIASGVWTDDICAVTAFGGDKVGVLWSNQISEQFEFKYHDDGNPAGDWSTKEVAASGSSGDGVADDHINLAVGTDGTIYAAIKTSYDLNGKPTIALLERKPNPVSWNFYEVQNGNGTRPIALLDEDDGTIFVVYQQFLGGGPIMYKYSSINAISFPEAETPLNGSDPDDYQDVTSTKQNFTSEVAILFTVDHTDIWAGVLAGTDPLPVELSLFDAIVMEDKIILNWRTETEVNNYGFDIERLVEDSDWETLGFVEGHGNSNSPKEYSFLDGNINRSGQYNYRLKQIDNDGKFEYSNILTVYVGAPANFYLSQNYPNPFNPSTRIVYSIPNAEKVSLKIYDLLGREVALLVDEYKPAGTYTITFDASNLPGGVYFYSFSAGNFRETKKMSLVK